MNQMPLGRDKVNITFSMTKEEAEQLTHLVDYFGKYSIKPVHRTDVLRYLVSRYYTILESGKMEEVVEAIEGVLKDGTK